MHDRSGRESKVFELQACTPCLKTPTAITLGYDQANEEQHFYTKVTLDAVATNESYCTAQIASFICDRALLYHMVGLGIGDIPLAQSSKSE